MGDLWECAWRELQRRKGRAYTTIAGYLIAAAVVIVLLSVLKFSTDTASMVLSSTATHLLVFSPTTETCCHRLIDEKNEGFVANGRSTALLDDKLVDKVKEIPTVKDASPFLLFRMKDPVYGYFYTIGGYKVDQPSAVSSIVGSQSDVSGRMLTPQDTGKVLLEDSYARAMNLKIGAIITLAGLPYEAVGIVNPGVRPAKADIYLTFEEAKKVIERRSVKPLGLLINGILVEVKSAAVQDQALESIRNLPFIVSVASAACYKPAAKVMGMAKGAMLLLAGLIGAFSVIFALKSQLAAVVERRREIGILKSIGWSDSNVVSQILTESMLQACIGGLLGCVVAGFVLIFAPLKAMSGIDSPLSIANAQSFLIAAFALALILLGGLIAGIIPAMLAARQRPAEALRQ
ncbi:MAG: ABC transporter permease [Armatimonadota bacterium]